MGRVLTDEEVKRFEADGFLFPFDVFSEAETAKIAERFDGMERELGEEMQGRFRNPAVFHRKIKSSWNFLCRCKAI